MGLILIRKIGFIALALISLSGMAPKLMAADDSSGGDAELQAEMSQFSAESAKLRTDHIQQMRELHVKHINEMYDRKLAHNKEISALMMQMKPGDKEANKSLREQIKAKRLAFKEEEKKFREDFKVNVLKEKNKEFRGSMKKRHKNMKEKHQKK